MWVTVSNPDYCYITAASARLIHFQYSIKPHDLVKMVCVYVCVCTLYNVGVCHIVVLLIQTRIY